MGSSHSIDESTQQEISKKQEQILGQFAAEFRISYKYALVSHHKNAAKSTFEKKLPTRQLPDAALPSYPIREGYLVKSPGPTSIWGSYKERFFVAANKANNYEIKYYVDESAYRMGAEPRGTIHCKSLMTRRFNSVERNESPHGVKMEPYAHDPFGRVWYLRCSTSQEEDEWYDTLKQACYMARAPLDYNYPVIAAAFKHCLQKIAHLHEFWTEFDDFDERESMARFIFHVITRDHLQVPREHFSGSAAIDNTKHARDMTVYTHIIVAASAAWDLMFNSALGRTEAISAKITKHLELLSSEEEKLYQQVLAVAEETVGETLKEFIASQLFTSMGTLALPIGAAFTATAKAMNTYLLNEVVPALGQAGENGDSIADVKQQAEHECTFSYSRTFREGCNYAREIPTLIQDEAPFNEETGMSPWTVHWMLRDAVKELYRGAIQEFFYKYRVQLKFSTDGTSLVSTVMGEFLHDIPDAIAVLYQEIFVDAVHAQSFWRKDILKPMKEALIPIEETVRNESDVSSLINLEDILVKVLDNLLISQMKPFIVKAIEGRDDCIDIQALARQLKVDRVAFSN